MRIAFLVVATLSACGSSGEPGHDHETHDVGFEISEEASSNPDTRDGGSAETTLVGDPCLVSTSCPSGGSGLAVCLTTSPGGYCAVRDCALHGHDCPNDPGLGGAPTIVASACVQMRDGFFCMRLCGPSLPCRDGYTCVGRPDAAGHGSTNVCAPST